MHHKQIKMHLIFAALLTASAFFLVPAPPAPPASGNGFFPHITPEYCSRDMSSRSIEPLSSSSSSSTSQDDDDEVVDQLIQVQAIFRHGARTPWKNHKCWRNYNISWDNCNVFELNLPQLNDESAVDSNVYFRKVYDASPNQFGVINIIFLPPPPIEFYYYLFIICIVLLICLLYHASFTF